MGIITRMLKDKAVYWPPSGRKDKFGKVITDQPVEFVVRWEDRVTIIRDAAGQEKIFNCLIYVPEDVEADGQIWHGALADLPDDPSPPPDARLIKMFEKIPKLNYKEFLRTAYA